LGLTPKAASAASVKPRSATGGTRIHAALDKTASTRCAGPRGWSDGITARILGCSPRRGRGSGSALVEELNGVDDADREPGAPGPGA
jgi:hypothetical protein